MTAEGISETVSETRRKRGRPSCFEPHEQSLARNQFGDVKTERGRHNVMYRLRAVGLLTKDRAFAWLCDGEAMRESRPHSWRPTILAELGRIEDEDDMKALALRLCELKPKAHEAVAMIRRWRKGEAAPGSAGGLSRVIISSVNAYLGNHPGTPWQTVLDALDVVYMAVRGSAEEGE